MRGETNEEVVMGMFHPGMGGAGAVLMLLAWLTPTAVLAAVLILVMRPGRHESPPDRDPADQILAARYARGEIDDEEYRRRLAGLALH
jgi:putative membrane protein